MWLPGFIDRYIDKRVRMAMRLRELEQAAGRSGFKRSEAGSDSPTVGSGKCVANERR